MVKCLPEFEYFTVFLKNKNIICKIRRSKVTDYAALNACLVSNISIHHLKCNCYIIFGLNNILVLYIHTNI